MSEYYLKYLLVHTQQAMQIIKQWEKKHLKWLVNLEVYKIYLEKMEHAKESVKDAACRCKEKMQDKKDVMEDKMHKTKEEAKETRDKAKERYHDEKADARSN